MKSKRQKREAKIQKARVTYNLGDRWIIESGCIYVVRYTNGGSAWLAPAPLTVLASQNRYAWCADRKLNEHGYTPEGLRAQFFEKAGGTWIVGGPL